MSTKITADNGAEIQVGQLGITVDHPEGIASIWARLSPWQRRSLADALAQGAAVVVGGGLTAPESQYKRERDAAVARAKDLRNSRDAWKACATRAEQERENWRVTATNCAAPAVSRADIEKAVRRHIPNPHFSEPIADEVCALFGIEAEATVDPVEEQTDALADILYGDEMVTDQMRGVLERVVRAGMLFPEQEADQ